MAEKFATKQGFHQKLNMLPLPVRLTKEDTTQKPPLLQIKLEKHLNVGCYLSSGEAIDVTWLDDTTFEVKAKDKISSRREKYTCTAKADGERWYWFSYLWIFND